MKIHIVTERGNWILPRWSREWGRRLPATVSTKVDNSADINFYVNYGFYDGGSKGVDVCYFTHREEGEPMRSKFDDVAVRCDWCVCQSQVTFKKVNDRLKSSIIRPGINEAFYLPRSLIIGIVGRDYEYTPRKRFHWIPKLEKAFPEYVFTHTKDVDENDMPSVYDTMDYLLITADNEGGPMPVVEALARGVPVIAPEGVGWCDEFSLIRYNNTYEGVVDVLDRLTFPKHQWSKSTVQLRNLFKKLSK